MKSPVPLKKYVWLLSQNSNSQRFDLRETKLQIIFVQITIHFFRMSTKIIYLELL